MSLWSTSKDILSSVNPDIGKMKLYSLPKCYKLKIKLLYSEEDKAVLVTSLHQTPCTSPESSNKRTTTGRHLKN